eukprot:gb/GEZJ01000145.1/.p2 GENE.gb/GEZJ01000145.1/~~gb/GEZJ01000145.1/.p2  ORF type:complete len:115 (+),score=11.54 gb/GEZJ01000145.1/:429-773(+)
MAKHPDLSNTHDSRLSHVTPRAESSIINKLDTVKVINDIKHSLFCTSEMRSQIYGRLEKSQVQQLSTPSHSAKTTTRGPQLHGSTNTTRLFTTRQRNQQIAKTGRIELLYKKAP